MTQCHRTMTLTMRMINMYYNKPTGADAFRTNTQSLLSELAMLDTNESQIPRPPMQRPMHGPSTEVPVNFINNQNPFQDPLTLPIEQQYNMAMQSPMNQPIQRPMIPGNNRGGASDFPSDDGNQAPYRGM